MYVLTSFLNSYLSHMFGNLYQNVVMTTNIPILKQRLLYLSHVMDHLLSCHWHHSLSFGHLHTRHYFAMSFANVWYHF